ncbi:DUF2933 domain-containing protein [Micromonospora aurantiaca]|jgi:hypothetical protein|uniref:DUF2933 domain-containing protein n=1 Tax=Micromonospora aurantiaca (nom. illeg.) TaxID=47850 RepID=A0A1C6TNJ8_9ACTN|nr:MULTISPECIES: DUF2933 domain-containing protein [Micromonospora]ADU09734.1 hypothetical protein ML5_4232 [Micromonospora sp. L5]AXH93635.1 DUF2933 domain-containing protein [Micromonospora aurantiaca]KAB1118668.1 DUF2933 domain-containing protein [Micromonospora aurantiaca]MBC8992558.1 DUF2933 domain-containing protein [Micromonospora chalcea]MBC9005482.1 DUF2933 domain-containing protein [Micromonospora aurantiaca]
MRRHLPLYVTALVILIAGALAIGVPARSVAYGLLALACPLMMLFMHGGHGDHSGHSGGSERRGPSETNSSVR